MLFLHHQAGAGPRSRAAFEKETSHLESKAALPPPRTRAQLTADELEDSVDTFTVEI